MYTFIEAIKGDEIVLGICVCDIALYAHTRAYMHYCSTKWNITFDVHDE